MKKNIFLGLIVIILLSTKSVQAKNNFDFNLSDFNLKETYINNEFTINYNLDNKEVDNSELKNQIKELSKDVTYLLLGKKGEKEESADAYYQRKKEYLKLRYSPKIPKDDTTTTKLDENSQEYKDDLVSGLAVPGMFNILDELDILYNKIDSIKVNIDDDVIISKVTLNDIKMKQENSDKPMEYKTISTNLILYYYFKKLDNDYKLYYLFAENQNDLDDYLDNSLNNESSKSILENYDTDLKKIYNFEKLNDLDNDKLNDIFNKNNSNSVVLNSYNNGKLITSANGFLISDGFVVTTWDFMKNTLTDGQYFVIRDSNLNNLEFDGIVTLNMEENYVLIKLKNKLSSSITVNNNEVKSEDVVVSISSKSGIGKSLQRGLVISNDNFIQTSIPLIEEEQGSPLYDQDGNLIGMNTATSINSTTSIAVSNKILNALKIKADKLDFENVNYVSFDKLKEKYFIKKSSKENVINNISSSKWKKISKIGNLKDSINLQLVKGFEDNNVVSLRYYNELSDYINSMQFANKFKSNLENNGYEKILNTDSKIIYSNKKYKVIIMEEFNYLIILVVKL